MDRSVRLIVFSAVVVLSLGACDPYFCGAYATEVDGECVGEAPQATPEEPPTVEEWIATAGDCTLREPAEPAVDLQAGCVGEACLGDVLTVFSDRLGEEPDCNVYLPGEWSCAFTSGVRVRQRSSTEGEGPDADVPVSVIVLTDGFTGTTAEGLGLGVSPVCFVDELGMPDVAYLIPGATGAGNLALATWVDPTVRIVDGAHPVMNSTADGATDQIMLFE